VPRVKRKGLAIASTLIAVLGASILWRLSHSVFAGWDLGDDSMLGSGNFVGVAVLALGLLGIAISFKSPAIPAGVPASSPPASYVASTATVARSVEYVGFWKRVVAFVIDSFIVLVVTVPLLLAIYGFGYSDRAGSVFAGFWDFVIQVVFPAVAVIVFWRYRGATPGKMAISAKILDAQTLAVPSTGRLVARYFAYLVSMLPLFIGFVWIGIDRRKQGFHDKIAGTVVVYDDD